MLRRTSSTSAAGTPSAAATVGVATTFASSSAAADTLPATAETPALQRFSRPKYRGMKDAAVIFTIFGITGTSSMFIVRPLLRWLATLAAGDAAASFSLISGPWWFRIMYFVVMTPIYSALLLGIASAFGRFDYFYQRVIAGMWSLLLPLPRRKVLNGYVASTGSSADAVARLHAVCRELLSGVDQLVDYDAVKQRLAAEPRLLQALADLATLEVTSLSAAQRTALFINVYNTLTVHGVVELRPRASPLRRLSFYSSAAYYIDKYELTLSDIEHGILRANRPHPMWPTSAYWGRSDPRSSLALDTLDARIHFALNCAAMGCPRIRVYSAERLDEELDVAARAFCALEVDIAPSGAVSLSKLFDWYATDFAPEGTKNPAALMRSLRQWLPPARQAVLDEVLKSAPGSLTLTFRPYDWKVNAVKAD